jgi:hypothetical protein
MLDVEWVNGLGERVALSAKRELAKSVTPMAIILRFRRPCFRGDGRETQTIQPFQG